MGEGPAHEQYASVCDVSVGKLGFRDPFAISSNTHHYVIQNKNNTDSLKHSLTQMLKLELFYLR